MRAATIAAACLIVGAAWWWSRRREGDAPEAGADPGWAAPILSLYSDTMQALDTVDEGTAQVNIRAFLATIRYAEGTAGPQGYRMLFGGRLFEGYADHPRIAQQFTDGAGRRLWTTAAGAYQFMAVSPLPTGGTTKVDTWDRIKRKLGLTDFSPYSQDLAAIELIREAGALADVRAGRFAQAVAKVRGIWASLPGAGYAQPEKTLAALQRVYTRAGGTIA